MSTAFHNTKLIQYCSSHPSAFGFQFSCPPDNITLNPVNRKTDQRLCDFQTGMGAAAHAILDTEQHISHIRTPLVDTIASLQDSDGEVIPVQGVLQLLTKIHDIPENSVSKWDWNTIHILASLFNSAYR